jgi:hypothetical protein
MRCVFSMATLALILQISFILIFSALNKTSPAWSDGSFLSEQLKQYGAARPLGKLLLNYPWLLENITVVTKYIQGLLGIGLIFARTRPYSAAGIIGMHTLFFLSLRLIQFPLIGITSMLGLLYTKVPDRHAKPCSHSNKTLQFFTNGFLILSLCYVFASNLSNLPMTNFKIPPPVSDYGKLFGLDQSWHMFGPIVNRFGWFYFEGKTENGRKLGLWGQPNLSDFREKHAFKEYDPAFSFLFFKRMGLRNIPAVRRSFAQYLCHNPRTKLGPNEKLFEINVYYNENTTVYEFKNSKGQPLISKYCF